MEYQVPQFIEVEDKIFGPLTFKQFIYVAGGTGICAVLVLKLGVLGFFLAIPVAAFAGALAFYKVNNKSFIDVLEAGFNYYTGGRLYLWRKDTASEVKAPIPNDAPQINRENLGLSKGKLRDLAWSLDIKDVKPGSES
jgi:hypothetical protein